MNNSLCDALTRLDRLHGLFASATSDASTAMCRWTDGLITMTVDEVREIALEDAVSELLVEEEPMTMVVLGLAGKTGGAMILMFDDADGRKLASSLLKREASQTAEWSELEKSALTETGNILGCAYLNAITRLIDVELVPSPPYFIQDYAESVVQQALLAQAETSDRVLVCRTGFHREDVRLGWRVLFVPTRDMREAMERSLHRAP